MIARFATSTFLSILSLVVLIGVASAQEYPVRPITLIVPFTAGGPTDVAMRAISEAAAKHLGQPIIVDNKAGGSGTVGPATMAASAKPDGYTLSQIPATVFTLPMMQETTWSVDDFSYIVQVSGYVFAIYGGTGTPFKTWKELIAYAKQNPGGVTYGSAGSIGAPRFGMELIAERDGIKFTHVPFKGSAEVAAAVAGGHVMLGASSLEAKPLAEAGKVRYLNVWTEKRIAALPEIPTLHELGYPFTFDGSFGIAGPKGMDPKIVAKIHDAFKKALEEPAVIDALARYDMVPSYKSTADYKASIAEWTTMQTALLKRLGLLKK